MFLQSDIASKICTLQKLVEIRRTLLEQGRKVVFTNGCFDILHRGHVEYLAKAREFGDALFLGLNSDASVNRIKGAGRPLMPQEDRAFILASLIAVDYLTIFDEDTPFELIRTIQPDILVKGSDYQVSEIVGRDVVENRGGKVEMIPFIPNRSTTNIIQKISALTKQGIIH